MTKTLLLVTFCLTLPIIFFPPYLLQVRQEPNFGKIIEVTTHGIPQPTLHIAITTTTTTIQPQGIECSNCVAAAWGERCTGGGNCAGEDPNSGCVDMGAGQCCSCARGFLVGGGWFGGSYNPKRRTLTISATTGIISDLRIGDEIHYLGQTSRRRLSRIMITSFTPNRPARQLRLRTFRPSTGTWLDITWKAAN